MTLTEQWQKGELPDGLYYVENNDNIVGILDWSKFAGGYNIKEVLAEVPTFEKYQANEKYIDYLKQCISVYESKDKQHAIDYLLFEETLEANKQIEHENTLLKVAIAELRDRIDILEEQQRQNLDIVYRACELIDASEM